uniref:HicB-like antitoxin of toxin-antitoxin system domain-containing protein n=1 Tax=Candidatus Kentrum sp. LFY TaxID=2126342 RepID=A0A450UV65_9GAMM|nr:MAG: Uncharacterised protein family (UPF0150) [Candidatus Kentron sp. LFY]VFJ96376.1 MAG: Uncharacterised protein family (UPF0150) [Candidatus Kentron sp. LFY]
MSLLKSSKKHIGFTDRGPVEIKTMRYTVVLEPSEEGVAASVPGLPGCHSQGNTEQEALKGISDAVYGYLEVGQGTNRMTN